MQGTTIGVHAFLDPRDQHPYVLLSMDNGNITQPPIEAKLNTEQARQISMQLLDCAAIAEQDAFLIDFLADKLGIEVAKIGQLLKEFQGWRNQQRGK